jgi:hypothetical protein
MSTTNTGCDAVFTYFPLLPPELREMVWKYALPGPRMIKVTAVDVSQTMRDRLSLWSIFPCTAVWEGFIEQSPIATPLLHTCHRSRTIALKTYEATFTPQLRGSSFYFNWELDTLYFQTDRGLECFFYHYRKSASEPQRFPDCDLTWQNSLRKMAVCYPPYKAIFTGVYKDLDKLEKLDLESSHPPLLNWGRLSNTMTRLALNNIWRKQIETGRRERNPTVKFVQPGELEGRI